MATPTATSPKTDDWDVSSTPSTCSRLNSMECWDYTIELECLQGPEDLQLAAELGRTLLERNKELETSLQHHQEKIEEQELEIEYLTKQHNALREANESRLRVYEQLDISIQNLECEKNQYLVENSSYKKQIKALSQNVENLDNKCEEITKTLEETKRLLDIERRKNERLQNESNKSAERTNFVALKPIERDEGHLSEPEEDEITEIDTTQPENFSYAFKNQSKSTDVTGSSSSACPFEFDQSSIDHLAEENEELIKIMQDLERTKKCLIAEQNRVAELEEQLAIMAQENHLFQSKLADINTNEEMKSVQQELSFLEEVRQGQMCSRCLKGFDQAYDDESSMITGTEDDESLMELMQNADTPHIYRSAVTITTSSPKPDDFNMSSVSSTNPYRELVEKYEALLEMQRTAGLKMNKQVPLGDELNSGDFSSLNTKFTDDEDAQKSARNPNVSRMTNKGGLRTPTDFSEAETLSSGFSDETSNKGTQTEGKILCTVSDEDDCKYSIYKDGSAIDSRFRFRPEYQEIFKEIFTSLKKAAENKDEGKKLPLIDETKPFKQIVEPKVPPVTPAHEELPSQFSNDADDNQSVISVMSSAVSETSVAMSECITKSERRKIKKQAKYTGEQENKPPAAVQVLPDGRILTPYKRDTLEYLTVSVGVKNKKSKRRRNREAALDRSDSPIVPSPPRVFTSSGKKGRGKFKEWTPTSSQPMPPATTSSASSSRNYSQPEWNGHSMTIYNRSMHSNSSAYTPNNSKKAQNSTADTSSEIDFKPSSASQELSRLKKLDMSYAEVLRRADYNKAQIYRRK